MSGYVGSCERYGVSRRRLLAVFSPAANALRLTVSGNRTASWLPGLRRLGSLLPA